LWRRLRLVPRTLPQWGSQTRPSAPQDRGCPGRDAGPGLLGIAAVALFFPGAQSWRRSQKCAADAYLRHADDDQLPAAAVPPCPQGTHYSFTMGDCESDR
jgi:hypothetical protein